MGLGAPTATMGTPKSHLKSPKWVWGHQNPTYRPQNGSGGTKIPYGDPKISTKDPKMGLGASISSMGTLKRVWGHQNWSRPELPVPPAL